MGSRVEQSIYEGVSVSVKSEGGHSLYQVIFAGSGPNRTKKLIMKRSLLLEVYRSMQRSVEDNFYLTHRTVRHSKPKMTKTLRRLGEYIAGLDGHVFQAGRETSMDHSSREWHLQDSVTEGFALLAMKESLFSIGSDEGSREDEEGVISAVTGVDIGVD